MIFVVQGAPLYACEGAQHFLFQIVVGRKVISQDDDEDNIDTKFWTVSLDDNSIVSLYVVPSLVGDCVFVCTVAILRVHCEAVGMKVCGN